MHVCPLEMLRAHLNVGWTAVIPIDICTTNSFGKPSLQPHRMAFPYHKDHQDLPAETEHVKQTSAERLNGLSGLTAKFLLEFFSPDLFWTW